jgi:hypothetical protein
VDGAVDAALDDTSAAPELADSEAVERLLISDGLEPRLYAYDVPGRRLLDSFALDARAHVYAGAGGRYGYALSGAHAHVRIVDMGLLQRVTAQGTERQVAPVALLGHSLSGSAPGALLAHAGRVVVFFEGDAKAEIIDESPLPTQLDTQTISLGAAHRGFALPFGAGFLATRSEAGEVVLGRYGSDGVLDDSASFDCAAPEGVALAGTALAIGCEAGVLRFDAGGPARLIAYPAAAGSPAARVRRLAAHPNQALYLAVLGEQLCAVGPSQLTCQPLGQPWLDFGFDASGKRALVLARDGSLGVFDASTLQLQGTLQVTTGVSASDELLQPQLASGRRVTYVSDPQAASVHMVDPARLSLVGRLELPGAPSKLAVFGFGAPR